MWISGKSDQNCDLYGNFLYILTLRIRNQGPLKRKTWPPPPPPSVVEGVRIVVISFRNIAKKHTYILKSFDLRPVLQNFGLRTANDMSKRFSSNHEFSKNFYFRKNCHLQIFLIFIISCLMVSSYIQWKTNTIHNFHILPKWIKFIIGDKVREFLAPSPFDSILFIGPLLKI